MGGYIPAMDFLDYKLGKLALFVVLAGAWGLYCGLTGRDLTGRRKPPASGTQDSQDDQQR